MRGVGSVWLAVASVPLMVSGCIDFSPSSSTPAADAAADADVGSCPSWALTGGGLAGLDDEVTAMAVGDCAAFVCGTYRGVLELTGTPLPSKGAADVFVARIDAGEVTWATSIAATGADRCNDIATDNEIVVVGGSWNGVLEIEGGALSSAPGQDGFIASFEAAGGGLTSFDSVSGSGDNGVTAVAVFGDSFLAGGFASDQFTVGGTLFVGTGVFLSLLGTDGVVDRITAVASGGSDHGVAAILPKADGVVLGLTGLALTDNTCAPAPEGDAGFLVGLDEGLDCEWAVSFDTTADDEVTDAAAFAGGYLVIGNTPAPLALPGVDSIDEGGTGPSDGFLAEVASNGVATRLRIHGGSGVTAFRSVAATASEAVVVAEFDGAWPIAGRTLTATSNRDLAALVVPASADTTVEVAAQLGGAGNESVASVKARGGDYLIGGSYDAGFTLDGTALPNPTATDFFVATTDLQF